MVYYGGTGDDEQDIFVMHVRTKEKRRLSQPGGQRGGRLSPDGRWIAYLSIQGGRTEIIVQPWPALDAKYLVSPNGGDEPAWSADSRQLFFRSGSAMIILPVATGPTWTPSQPVKLFRGAFARDPSFDQSYDARAMDAFSCSNSRPARDSRSG